MIARFLAEPTPAHLAALDAPLTSMLATRALAWRSPGPAFQLRQALVALCRVPLAQERLAGMLLQVEEHLLPLEVARANACKMLERRGYQVPELVELRFHARRGEDKILVVVEPKVGVGEVREHQDAPAVLFISEAPWSAQAQQLAPASWENFTVLELQLDPVDMAPPQRFLDADERAKLLRDFRVTAAQLPRIKRDDAIVRYYGAKAGDVLHTVNDSVTAGTADYWRVVT